MNEMPLISIIVPVYNVEHYLSRCIDSIIKQTYQNLEIILVDDGSQDGSPAICDEYARKDDRITVIHKENGGAASARNAALKGAKGEYIFFLDGDDFIHPECIGRLYDISIAHQCDIVQCDYEKGTADAFSTNEEIHSIKFYQKEQALTDFRYKTIVWGKLLKRNTLNEIYFPEGKIYEDEAVYYRFTYRAAKIAITDDRLYYYYQTNQSVMRNKDEIQKDYFTNILEERIAFFEEKKEPQLVRSSIERYLVILMLYYASWRCNKRIKNDPQPLRQKFKENYKKLQSFRGTSYQLRLMFWLVYHFPRISSRAIYILRKQG